MRADRKAGEEVFAVKVVGHRRGSLDSSHTAALIPLELVLPYFNIFVFKLLYIQRTTCPLTISFLGLLGKDILRGEMLPATLPRLRPGPRLKTGGPSFVKLRLLAATGVLVAQSIGIAKAKSLKSSARSRERPPRPGTKPPGRP